MADIATLIRNVHDLSDLELAALTALVAGEHCVISSHHEILNDLAQELSLVSTGTLEYRRLRILIRE